MTTKIKIVRGDIYREDGYHTFYDVFHGFTGIPSTWPFMTKWIPDKMGLTELQLKKYMTPYLTDLGKVKIIVKAYKQPAK